MQKSLAIVSAPSSAGAYAPGQEKAPAALLAAGLVDMLAARGVTARNFDTTPSVRWCPDKDNRVAMNLSAVGDVARSAADRVNAAQEAGAAVLVLGGDCTVEMGTVAGCTRSGARVGVVYMDLDTDLNAQHR